MRSWRAGIPVKSRRRVTVGPFKVRWARIGLCALSWFLLMPIGFLVAQSTRFECGRNPGEAPHCEYTFRGPLTQTHKRVLDTVVTVEVYQHSSGKSGSRPYYVVCVLDQRGRDTEIDNYSDPYEAYADRDWWRAYFSDPNANPIVREKQGSAGGALLVALFIALGLGIALNELRTGGRLIFDFDFEHQRLTARRTRFAVTVGTPKQFLLHDVSDFGLEYTELQDWLKNRYSPAELGARIVLLDRQGCKSWITRNYLRDSGVFADGLAELRAALKLGEKEETPSNLDSEATGVRAADSQGEPLERAATETQATCEAVSASSESSLAHRNWWSMFKWPALPSGSWLLIGTFVLAIIGNVLLNAYANATQGWLVMEPRNRCRFSGAELAPGALTSMSLEPGTYSIEVFNPGAAGGWEKQQFEIALGKTTYVHCEPYSGANNIGKMVQGR